MIGVICPYETLKTEGTGNDALKVLLIKVMRKGKASGAIKES